MSNHRIALITDSTSDIPQDLRKKYGIKVVPLYVIWGGDELKDGVDVTYESFYERLPNDPNHPTTSQPTPADFIKALEEAKAEGAEEAVVIAISDGLSGTLDSVRQAAQMVEGIKTHIHDSRAIAMGLGFQVLAAAQAREAGGDAEAMITAADSVRKSSAIIFTVDTLEYLHRGGRIGGAAKLLGSALQLKPQLLIDTEVGLIEAGEKVRTRKKALDSVYRNFFAKMNGGNLHVAIIHAEAEGDAYEIKERIETEYNPATLIVTNVSPVIGVHGGPGILGIVGYYD